MASSAPLLSGTIEADDDTASSFPRGNIGQNTAPPSSRQPVVLVPGAGNGTANVDDGSIVSLAAPPCTDLTREQAGIFRSSSHPVSLAFFYLFRSAAIAVYVLCGLCEYRLVDR